VTTVDLISVLEAIEENLIQAVANPDADFLRDTFQSILLGGEKVGFDLTTEKTWLNRLPTIITKAVS
jgi:hypothetical protein